MSILATITQRSLELGLPFVLAGGHAVVFHGVARSTFDLDLIIQKGHRAGWIDLLAGLDYTICHESPAFLQLAPRDENLLPVDLMLVNERTFQKLLAEAQPAPAQTNGAKVVSLLHLLALKCHAVKFGHAGRFEKDIDDLLQLVRINNLDVNSPALKTLLLEHGTPELYERIKRAGERQS